MDRGSWFVLRGALIVVRVSRFSVLGLRLEHRGPRFAARRSRLATRGCWIVIRDS